MQLYENIRIDENELLCIAFHRNDIFYIKWDAKWITNRFLIFFCDFSNWTYDTFDMEFMAHNSNGFVIMSNRTQYANHSDMPFSMRLFTTGIPKVPTFRPYLNTQQASKIIHSILFAEILPMLRVYPVT